MTQEEKFKEAKRLYETANADQRYVLESLFPELKNPEDERIRKELIEYFQWGAVQYLNDFNNKKIVAWLEKQEQHTKFMESIQIGDKVTRNRDGVLVNLSQLNRVAKPVDKQTEKNPADNVEPKFHEGDIIIHKELGGDYIHNPHKIIQVDILDKKYRLEGGLVAHFSEQEDYELVEQKSAEWQKANLWKDAQGDDLPEIDREVIAILDNGKVVFGHRPYKGKYIGKSLITGNIETLENQTFDEGGWNIPDVKYWLDVELPKEMEE